MRAFLALAFLAVVCAAVDPEPVQLPEPALPYVEDVNVAAFPDLGLEDDLRVQIVDVAQPDFAADQNPVFENNEGFQQIGPSELESLRVELPEGYDPLYGYVRDPMWR